MHIEGRRPESERWGLVDSLYGIDEQGSDTRHKLVQNKLEDWRRNAMDQEGCFLNWSFRLVS